jgi:hypothetical protein
MTKRSVFRSLLVAALVATVLFVPISSAVAAVFTDGFESGDTSAWSQTIGGVIIGSAGPFAPAPEGAQYARLTTTRASAYLQKSVAPTSELYVDFKLDVGSAPGGLTISRMTTASGNKLVSLKLTKNSKLQMKNHVTGDATTSATTLPTGWHELQLHARVGVGLVEVWLDGAQVGDLSASVSLGTTQIGVVQMGTNGSTSGFDIGLDAVTLDTAFIGSGGVAPSTPTGLGVTNTTSTTASLVWNAASGATGYGVYRDGSKVVDVFTTSFADSNLSPSTSFQYSVDAFNVSGRSTESTPVTATTASGGGTTIVVKAGADMACDPADPDFNNGAGTAVKCQQMATSNLLPGADTVLALGDTQFDCGGSAAFSQSYGPSWGRFKPITWASVGDNEYNTPAQAPNGTGCSTLKDAAAYFDYFGNRGGSISATPLPGVSQSTIPGVYSFNLPEGCLPGVGGTCAWHVVALNSNCDFIGGCDAGSAMDTWLQADLAANTWARCTMAFEHVPRYASPASGPKLNSKVLQLWQDYVSGGVDVVLNSSVHFYERYAPQDAFGNADLNGTAEFLIGVGGHNVGSIAPAGSRLPNSEAGQSTTFGVIQFTLTADSYSWSFLPILGGTYSDGGTRACT